MNSTHTETNWLIINGIQRDLLANALHIGDNQHRQPLTVVLQTGCDDEKIVLDPMKLRIETTSRRDGSGDWFKYEGYLQTQRGMLRVEGSIRTLNNDITASGDLQVMHIKRCPNCVGSQGTRPETARRCQTCGAPFVVVGTPVLVP